MTHRFDRRAIPAAARETMWTAADGQQIRRLAWGAPDPGTPRRGAMLFLPGRGDAYEKYLETFEDWRLRGWQVCAADWRGQAGSGRFGRSASTGHIEDFMIWVRDLAAIWADFAVSHQGPLVLVGHSMGGHLVLRAAVERALDPLPDALVLSAPMFDVQPDLVPRPLRRGLARLMARLGDPRRAAWGDGEKPMAMSRQRQFLLTHDDDRYDDERFWREARPELLMGGGSWGWVRAAMDSVRALMAPGALERVTLPTLVVATTADRLVSPRATREVIARLPDCEALVFGAEARHEVLREIDPVRDRAMARIDQFLAARLGG